MPLSPRVPIVDLSEEGKPGSRSVVIDTVRGACEEVGFLVITGHGVSGDVISAMETASRQFFALPLDEKLRYVSGRPGVYRGYRPVEHAALALSRDIDTPPDLCEAFSINRFDDPEVARRSGLRAGREAFFAPNIWPVRPKDFKQTFERYYAAMEDLAERLMTLMALALGLDEHWFDDKIRDHITGLTVNHYPKPDRPVLPGQLRRGEHTDWGSLTILYSDGEPGLQIKSPDRTWEDVPTTPGSFIINLGDLMAAWTNDRWTSTLHRVTVPEGGSTNRLSIAFFHQPAYDARIECIPTCLLPNELPSHAPITSGEWLTSMLQKTNY